MRLLGLALVSIACVWHALASPSAQAVGGDDHFKYGSVGIESQEGLPYWIWQVLPRLFADKLPKTGSYESLGFVWWFASRPPRDRAASTPSTRTRVCSTST